MTDYRALTAIPPLVSRALALAEAQQFTASCIAEVGRFLAALAATIVDGTLAELGTGCGAGTAWLASGLQPGARLVTVERDEVRAAAVAALFAGEAAITVLRGEWSAILDHAPFALLFADTPAKYEEPERLLAALRPGGVIVLDDLTPVAQWPEAWRGQRDPVRDFWLSDPRLLATEILTTPDTAAIIATRRG